MSLKRISVLCTVLALATSAAGQEIRTKRKRSRDPRRIFDSRARGTREGVVIERQTHGRKSLDVRGDPCIVWDEAIHGWRMVFFYSPPGHGQAVCLNLDDSGLGKWTLEGPLPVVNPEAVGWFHKPFIVMDPDHPNCAAKIEGRYCLLVVGSNKNGQKQIQRAWSEKLGGPWKFEPDPLIPLVAGNDFDARTHRRGDRLLLLRPQGVLVFLHGISLPRNSRGRSVPSGRRRRCNAKAGREARDEARRRARAVPAGWSLGVGLGRRLATPARTRASLDCGSQCFADCAGPGKKTIWTEEPPPSLGGFAWCDEKWPVRGWHFAAKPIEWVKDIPKPARDAGEGYDLWRQFIHIFRTAAQLSITIAAITAKSSYI